MFAKVVVDMKVLSFIAEKGDEDIRSLIGKLTKVIFASKLHECPITIELVKDALKESATETQEDLQVEDIINCVCNFYKISKNDMLGKKDAVNYDAIPAVIVVPIFSPRTRATAVSKSITPVVARVIVIATVAEED